MHERLNQLKCEIMEHTREIWTEEPTDIYLLKNGYSASGAGIHGQYFTTIVMLSGEIRALGIHIFTNLLKFSRSGNFSIEQLKQMTESMLQVDLGVVSYFGLPEYGALLAKFHEFIGLAETREEFEEVMSEMFTLTNRYQLWLHQVFPWYLGVHFPKTDPAELRTLLQKIEDKG